MTMISGISNADTGWAAQASASNQLFQTVRSEALSAAASALNVQPDQLQQQMQSGKSLQDVAKAQGVDFSTVQQAITSAVQPTLDQATQNGQISSRQEQNILTRLTSGQTAEHAHGHHHHGGGAMAAPAGASDAASVPQVLGYSPTGSTVSNSTGSGQQVDTTA